MKAKAVAQVLAKYASVIPTMQREATEKWEEVMR